ncbi:MAG: hypothetical protein SFU86_17270 [Pirellulaceae bacterium]|nr:hypothetical protein [Pirellulaceae bacterium]
MSKPAWFTWKDPTTMHRVLSVRLAHVSSLEENTKDYCRVYTIGLTEALPLSKEQLEQLKRLLGVDATE